VDSGHPIAYQALPVGTPVVSSSGTEFGKVHHVLQVPSLDLFDGISVDTAAGLRFVDRDQITDITTTMVRCELSDEEAAALPPPDGTDAVALDLHHDDGHSLSARIGRMFGRTHWKDLNE